jgi:hypothetical protein
MSGSCCGGSPKSEAAKVTMAAEAQATETATEQPAANTKKTDTATTSLKKAKGAAAVAKSAPSFYCVTRSHHRE